MITETNPWDDLDSAAKRGLCVACKWWDRVRTKTGEDYVVPIGCCRINPPLSEHASQPMTDWDDRCSRFTSNDGS